MILGQLWMKKQGVILNMTNNFLAFWLGYCTYIGAISLLGPLSLLMKTIAVKIEKNIISQKMITKSSKKDMTNFLQTPNKLSSKKKRQINKNKQKASIGEISLNKATINSLKSSDKKNY